MRSIHTNGVELHVAIQGSGPPVVLLHGWPEFHVAWRHQIPALANAGYTVIAPDLRGFGNSSAPSDVNAYGIHTLVADVTGVLDALKLHDAVVVGHDWGGIIAWHAALLAESRVRAVASLNMPWRGRSWRRPTTEFARTPGGRFNYILMLQQPGAEQQLLMGDLPTRLTQTVVGNAADASFWTEDVRDAYVQAFETCGGHWANYYRNMDSNWENTKQLVGRKVKQPALMIAAEKDPVLWPSMTDGMDAYCDDLRVKLIPDCGHWTQQEKPDEVNALLVEFLDGLS